VFAQQPLECDVVISADAELGEHAECRRDVRSGGDRGLEHGSGFESLAPFQQQVAQAPLEEAEMLRIPPWGDLDRPSDEAFGCREIARLPCSCRLSEEAVALLPCPLLGGRGDAVLPPATH